MRPAENPFRVSQIESIPFVFEESSDFETTWDQFSLNGYKAMIVGPHGSGKTTLLTQFGEWLEQRGDCTKLVRFRTDSRKIDAAMRLALRKFSGFVLLDGAEQLSHIEWLRFLMLIRNSKGLLATSHKEFRLPTIYRTRPSPELFYKLTKILEANDYLPNRDNLLRLYQHYNGNVRDIFRYMYDDLQAKGVKTPANN